MTDHVPMKLEKHYTCWIEWDGLAIGLLVSKAWFQLKIVKYWQWFWRQRCRDVASGTDRYLDITFGLLVVENSSLVSILFREAFSHPYIHFFSIIVKTFLLYIILYMDTNTDHFTPLALRMRDKNIREKSNCSFQLLQLLKKVCVH